MSNFFSIYFFIIIASFILVPLAGLLLHLNIEVTTKVLNDTQYWDSVNNTFIAAFSAAGASTLIAFGFVYIHLFNRNWAGYKLLLLISDLPSSLPHSVAGLALLLVFGQNDFFTSFSIAPISFTFSAVILAMVFVSFSISVKTLLSAARKIDPELILVSQLSGRNDLFIFRNVIVSELKVETLIGFLLSFARSSSEFAAVVLFGGNVAGKTQVLSSYVYSKLEEGEIHAAVFAGVTCLVFSLLLTIVLSYLGRIYARD